MSSLIFDAQKKLIRKKFDWNKLKMAVKSIERKNFFYWCKFSLRDVAGVNLSDFLSWNWFNL